MFCSLLEQGKLDENDVQIFMYYLKRHIELDSDCHGSAVLAMIEQVIQFDDVKTAKLKQAAKDAIASRRQLRDVLADELEARC